MAAVSLVWSITGCLLALALITTPMHSHRVCRACYRRDCLRHE